MKKNKKSSLKNGKKTVVLFAKQSMMESNPDFIRGLMSRTASYDFNFVYYDLEMIEGVNDYSNYFDLSFFDIALLSHDARLIANGEFSQFVYSGMKHRFVEEVADGLDELDAKGIIDKLSVNFKNTLTEVEVDEVSKIRPNYSEMIANISDMSIIDYSYYLCDNFGLQNYMLNVYTNNYGEARNVLCINQSYAVSSRSNKFQFRYFAPNLKRIENRYSILIAPVYYGNENLGYMTVDLKENALKFYAIIQSLSGNLLYSDTVVKKASLKDPLTKLSNRVYFKRRVNDLIQDKNNKIAIMYLDIDRFKRINDKLGHDGGDKVLEFVAQTLMDSAQKPEDVFRLNGDEFVVLLSKYKSNKDIIKYAKQQISTINKEIEIDGQKIKLDMNVGISTFPDDGLDCSQLLKTADKALEISKRYGLNHFSFYDPMITEGNRSEENVKRLILNSIENDNFKIQFQPRVSCGDGKITHFEALVRIQNDDEVLLPSEFIRIAEDNDMISRIDEYVLDLSCKEISTWNNKDEIEAHISVNISTKELNNPKIVDKYLTVIKKYGLKPQMFSLEINSSVISDGQHLTLGTINKFKEKGFKIVLDVDGFTFASLENLKLYPVDAIKIQKEVVENILGNKINQIIVQSLAMIAKELKYEIIAEGVENSLQYKFLKEVGCNEVQGFYFSEPKYANELDDFKKATYRFVN